MDKLLLWGMALQAFALTARFWLTPRAALWLQAVPLLVMVMGCLVRYRQRLREYRHKKAALTLRQAEFLRGVIGPAEPRT